MIKYKCLYGGVSALAVVQSAVCCLCAWLSLSGEPLLCGWHTSTSDFWMSQLQQAMCNWMACSACALEPSTVLGIKGMCVEILCLHLWPQILEASADFLVCTDEYYFVCLLALILKFKIYIFAEMLNILIGFWAPQLQLKKPQTNKNLRISYSCSYSFCFQIW